MGLVPLGYGDGVPRHAGNTAEVWVDGGAARSAAGSAWTSSSSTSATTPVPASRVTTVVLFGSGADGEPTADDWARACGTIHYEIVTRMGGRLLRRYVGGDAA